MTEVEAASFRGELARLRSALESDPDNPHFLSMLDRAMTTDDAGLSEFLASNELWGGAGSIADQAGFARGREVRRPIEAVLADLGDAQLRAGLVNLRTEFWVRAFREWQRRGL